MNNGGFNLIVLVGDVTSEPLQRGRKVKMANFQLTTTRFYRDRQTHLEKKAEARHEVVAFEELADVVLDHVKRGQMVLVTGMMQYYEDNGKMKAEVKADVIKVIKEA